MAEVFGQGYKKLVSSGAKRPVSRSRPAVAQEKSPVTPVRPESSARSAWLVDHSLAFPAPKDVSQGLPPMPPPSAPVDAACFEVACAPALPHMRERAEDAGTETSSEYRVGLQYLQEDLQQEGVSDQGVRFASLVESFRRSFYARFRNFVKPNRETTLEVWAAENLTKGEFSFDEPDMARAQCQAWCLLAKVSDEEMQAQLRRLQESAPAVIDRAVSEAASALDAAKRAWYGTPKTHTPSSQAYGPPSQEGPQRTGSTPERAISMAA